MSGAPRLDRFSAAGEYARHRDKALGLLARRFPRLHEDERLELYHAVWTTVLEKRRRGERIDNVEAYLMGGVDKLALKRLGRVDARRRVSIDPLGAELARVPDAVPSPEERVVLMDEARCAREIVNALAGRERDVFVALGGSSYAVVSGSIGSREIANNSVRGKDIRNRTIGHRDVKRNGLGGSNIKESRLGKVRRARHADRLGGASVGSLRLTCPVGTRLTSDACVETSSRPLQAYGGAAGLCNADFRRLASYEEVKAILAFSDINLSPGGELTGTPVEPSGNSTGIRVLAVTSQGGQVAVVSGNAAGARPFRCALDPTNSSPGAR